MSGNRMSGNGFHGEVTRVILDAARHGESDSRNVGSRT
jgi:hypothetical protein